MARILIVDDSPVERKILCQIVVALGHTIVGEAANGAQAFEAYTRLNPDMVTMDLNMDGSDGAPAIVNIITEFPEACIVVVSARRERQVIIDALERGARHFLIKPVSQEKVKAVVDNVLQQTFDKTRHLTLVRSLKEADEPIIESPNDSLSDGKPMTARVLIVDDSAVARKILREIVTALGHVVIGEVTNGSQAFVAYTRLKPDVVTMDLTMEGLNGSEATSKIIATYPEARIIIISAMEERRVIIDALERGARHFIIKPITQDKVAAVLNNVLQQEFDFTKHMERVRKMRGSEGPSSTMENGVNKCIPPYVISVQCKNLVHVAMDKSLTLTSFQSLLLEIEEYLTDTPRVLFDFGAILEFEQELLVQMDMLIMDIVDKSGVVKAISSNERFVDLIAQAKDENIVNVLADTLRYFER